MARHMRNGRDYSRPGPKVDYELRKDSNNAARSGEVYDKIKELQSQIVPTASIEMGETASKAYSVGDFLVKDGILYKVTKAIAKDDALTVGTNIVMTTVGSELNLHVNLDYSTLRDVVSNVSVTNVKTKVYTVEEDGVVAFFSYIANGSVSDGIIIYINDKNIYSQKYKGYFTSGLYPVKVGDVIAVNKDSAVTSKLTIKFIGYES